MAEEQRTPGVIAFPPLIYGVPLAVSLAADRLLSKKRLPPFSRRLAPGFFATAVSLVLPAIKEFRKAGTPIDVNEETTSIIEDGPFAYTRNPLYLALTCAYIGIALAFRAKAPFAMLPAVLWTINVGVIDREERYLERKFGDRYRNYKERVPRWL